jgi:hypothetical protein
MTDYTMCQQVSGMHDKNITMMQGINHHTTYQDAEKYNAITFLPARAEAVGTPVVLGLVRIFGPRRETLQCCSAIVIVGVGFWFSS